MPPVTRQYADSLPAIYCNILNSYAYVNVKHPKYVSADGLYDAYHNVAGTNVTKEAFEAALGELLGSGVLERQKFDQYFNSYAYRITKFGSDILFQLTGENIIPDATAPNVPPFPLPPAE